MTQQPGERGLQSRGRGQDEVVAADVVGVAQDGVHRRRLVGCDGSQTDPVARHIGHLGAVRDHRLVHRPDVLRTEFGCGRGDYQVDLFGGLEPVQAVLVVVHER